MKSFFEIAAYILEERGPMEVSALAKESLRVARRQELPQALKNAAARVLRMARTGSSLRAFSITLLQCALAKEHGLTVVGYPSFQLRTKVRPEWLPRLGWRNSAYKVLLPSNDYLGFREIFDRVVRSANFRFNRNCPEWQLYHNIAGDEGAKKLFLQRGTFRIGLEGDRRQRQTALRAEPWKHQSSEASQIAQKIHEANLEALIADDLDQVEPGLTLIGRQYDAPPVGRIDLLCRDRKGTPVVIEIKKLGASTESIIDQITRYIGWVQERVATPGKLVRGIIIVGRPDHKLTYSVSSPW